jgi:hypothetical protein
MLGRMKLRFILALPLLLLASCGSNAALINSATQRAEIAAERAQMSATKAEVSAQAATDAAERAQAVVRAAQWSAIRAIDVENRMEVSASCSHGIMDVVGHPYPCKPLSPEDWKSILSTK